LGQEEFEDQEVEEGQIYTYRIFCSDTENWSEFAVLEGVRTP